MFKDSWKTAYAKRKYLLPPNAKFSWSLNWSQMISIIGLHFYALQYTKAGTNATQVQTCNLLVMFMSEY